MLQSKKFFFSFFTLSSTALKIEELQEALRKKEEEMKQMEERYKKYLEKAKSVSVCNAFILGALIGGGRSSDLSKTFGDTCGNADLD